MTRALREYYGRRYGTLTASIVGDATGVAGLGRHFGAMLYEAEVSYLVKNEWARTAEEVIWRRTKNRLDMTDVQISAFTECFETAHAEAA